MSRNAMQRGVERTTNAEGETSSAFEDGVREGG